MIKHRQFLILLVVTLCCFIIFNLVTWTLFTESLVTDRYDGGDLARLNYNIFIKDYRKNHVTLARRHYLPGDLTTTRADVLTIGDSFSAGVGGGKNNFYQDYIATLNGIDVVNILPYQPGEDSSEATLLDDVIVLSNAGVLDQLKVKHVLIESVERFAVNRFSRPFDFKHTLPDETISSRYANQVYRPALPKGTSFINNGNIKLVYYTLLFKLAGKAPNARVFKLSRPLFSTGSGADLFCLKEDVRNLGRSTPAAIDLLNHNLNTMADMLRAKGITLYFMPVVDKYNLYRDYITGNRYGSSTFFEELRKKDKRYVLIDTKAILHGELEKGTKDIFFADDAHWTWKAPEKIFTTVRFSLP